MLNYKHRTIQNPAEGLVTSPSITFAASTAMLYYNPNRPVRIVRWGAIVSTACADNASATLQFRCDVYPEPNAQGTVIATGATATFGGSSTAYNASNQPVFYVDTGGGTLTISNAILIGSGGVPIGSVIWHNVNPQAVGTSGYYPDPDTALTSPGGVDTQLVIYPGQSVRLYCVGVGNTAGAGKMFLEVEELAFQADYNNNANVLSGYPSSNGTVPTPSWPFTSGKVFNAQS